jgi:hypothetical protein
VACVQKKDITKTLDNMNKGIKRAMQKTLYLATFDVGYTHILRVFYAADEAESQQKKSDLEREINAVCKSLEHFPKGFRLVMSTIPGTVEITEEVQPRTIEV